MTSRLVRSALGAWIAQGAPRVAALLTVLVVGLARPGGETHASRLRIVLGGPPVGVVAGQLQIGPPWTWLMLGLLFIVTSLPLVIPDPEAIGLTLVRGVSRRQWAVARLVTLGVTACAFLALILAVAALTVSTEIWPGPLLTSRTTEDIGLWALVLMGLGWWQLALTLVFDTPWPGFAAVVLLLGMSAFGSSLPPFLPTAQAIVALHGLPGTLSWETGAWYTFGWTVLGGVATWACAPSRLGFR